MDSLCLIFLNQQHSTRRADTPFGYAQGRPCPLLLMLTLSRTASILRNYRKPTSRSKAADRSVRPTHGCLFFLLLLAKGDCASWSWALDALWLRGHGHCTLRIKQMLMVWSKTELN